MPKQPTTKKTTTTTAAAPAAAPAAKPTVKKAAAPAATPVAAPVAAAAPAPAPVPEVATTETTPTEEVPVSILAANFAKKLSDLSSVIASLKADYRVIEKKQAKELKMSLKANSKNKRKNGNRKPSGFIKPTLISDELAVFLEKPVGTEMARTEVTKEINRYVKTNNLQDKTNGRHILPDSKLSKLLKLTSEDSLTYFNLQKYMSSHFPKPAVKA